MLIKTIYFGFYPLGADVCFNGVKIMQAQWQKYTRPLFILGKKEAVNPFFGDMYYVTEGTQTVFFVAVEDGLGHYRIFAPNDKAQKKLARKIGRKG